ncbi:50S ribosomal protein L25/general stress protein Ctc [Paenalcaligenes niemegkensis]|uniref:50S ribosomal protein L25/general stress protein Ctc n=1 Tax=Paenalcaligenes niemegkensis TaxID=2895469 RepID=UPI001EE916A8|nr:50S ribosomal protein L25/general stress protein Ctc [Paenalcaligenes niemegkensis]MCQ9617232.1 50S ribosomal protein L25/general stress protein Ctc [Paenalcaligenes niemegkensis]
MKFSASTRSVQGSGASRRLRRAGQVPAIVYGGTAEPQNIALDHNQIYHDLRKDVFHASILTMELDGKPVQVLLRSVQWHPYKQQVLHVDFQRVSAKEAITTRVPLAFINGDESPAVKLHSQVISQVLVELEITCLPADLPTSIEVDLGQMEPGTTISLSSIKLPEGVEYAGTSTDADPVLAAALATGGGQAAADEDDEGATGEENASE